VYVCAAGKAPAAKKAATGSGAKPKAKPAAKKGGARAPKRTGEGAIPGWLELCGPGVVSGSMFDSRLLACCIDIMLASC
jgi:hypothetical protein